MAKIKNAALDTLFYPFESGLIEKPGSSARVLFLNAQNHSGLSMFSQQSLVLQQYFKPYAVRLEHADFAYVPDVSAVEVGFDFVLIAAPKNQVETLYLLAVAIENLKSDGLLVVAAENKAGGARMVKNVARFGLKDVQSESRNKARVVWACKDGVDDESVQDALAKGAVQSVLDGQFQSWPGIYGWNKIDQGSQILLQHLPENLSGKGADFGCGYGLLSQHALQHFQIESLICIDADWRAIEMCRRNLADFQNAKFEWADLTQSQPDLKGLDFIVMNPPFHEGKTADISIGVRFIENAAQSLKSGGQLWMVANKQLAYESVLSAHFSTCEKAYEGQGFKVFCAVK